MNNATSVGQGLGEQWSLPEESEEEHAQPGADGKGLFPACRQ
jgi:hypothetical protein